MPLQIEVCTCGCDDTDAFVQDALPLLFPEDSIPEESVIIHDPSLLTDPLHQQLARAWAKEHPTYALAFTSTQVFDVLKGTQLQ